MAVQIVNVEIQLRILILVVILASERSLYSITTSHVSVSVCNAVSVVHNKPTTEFNMPSLRFNCL